MKLAEITKGVRADKDNQGVSPAWDLPRKTKKEQPMRFEENQKNVVS